MDPLGHASIGLMVKPLVPKAPLWALIAATAVPDLLFFGFEALGVEYQAVTQLDLDQGLKYLSMPFTPWSHGLFMCIVWSALLAGIAFLICHDRRTSIAIGLMVFGHWVLDFIVYPITPIFFSNSQIIGLGLITSGPGLVAGIVLEISLIIGGVAVYWTSRKRALSTVRG